MGRQAIDWREHERDMAIDGRRVHYVDIGSGARGFVLVHGLGGCWQHWTHTLPFLAQHGRAIALDLPGFGCSQPPTGSVSLDTFADTAAELASRAGIERAVFIGHSMGGPIALRFASRHTQMAEALILLAGAVQTFSALLGLRELMSTVSGRPRDAAAIFAEALTCGVPIPSPIKGLIAGNGLARKLTLWPYVHRPGALRGDTVALILAGAGARGVLPCIRAIGRSDPYAGLGEIACPILSIGGRHDHIVAPADIEALDGAASNVTSVLLDDVGHMAMLERPQAVNEQIARFLRG